MVLDFFFYILKHFLLFTGISRYKFCILYIKPECVKEAVSVTLPVIYRQNDTKFDYYFPLKIQTNYVYSR